MVIFSICFEFHVSEVEYIKSAVIKTTNLSSYWILFLGRWPLLQFFGKPLTGDTLDPSASTNTKTKIEKRSLQILTKTRNPNLYMKCDEVSVYGIYDAEIQQMFPFYATNDGNVQLPIACMKRNAELIISPMTTYIGLYDGYLNDNLNSFSVKRGSSETWIYTNGDATDAHALHFHLTSGFTSPFSNYNSPGLVSCKRLENELTYSRDIYQIGPQQIISFDLTWPHYSSYDTTRSPDIRCIGGVIHCHFLQHNDANSMIIQYFVD